MIKFNEIKIGDFLMGEYGGKMWEGEVVRLNGDEKQVCLATDVQDFWFETENLFTIAINDEDLKKLSFVREDMPDGSVKYKKGSFRILIFDKNDFAAYKEVWYREDRRDNPDIRYIHQLQNQYLQMTKVHLTDQVMA